MTHFGSEVKRPSSSFEAELSAPFRLDFDAKSETEVSSPCRALTSMWVRYVSASFFPNADGTWRFYRAYVRGLKIKKDGGLSVMWQTAGYNLTALSVAPQQVLDFVRACDETLSGGA